ncbi:uncharacterized protein EV154DRAFT_518006 [Mucor mucedo]|uniref:uncharacterized protein n=1 Tax=Mucor mucedo TaxID=29922 RepID=UPI002220F819|nr:uncharacterized protein EV154DRAFT_518006 [Mucor mucedo]KAI7888345.1 hypothetical protein EV154DRAFT_518006 [Mucor mucedo]
MNSDPSQIHNILEKNHEAHSDAERKKLAEEASKLHEKATGHSLKIDEHGNVVTECEEAKGCPALH